MCKLYFSTHYDPHVLTAVMDVMLTTETDGSGVGLIERGGASTVYHADPRMSWAPAGMLAKALKQAELPAHTGMVIAHGRTATGPRTSRNTHPLIHGNAFLAHNGVVDGLPLDPGDTDSWMLAKAWDESESAAAFCKLVGEKVHGMAAVLAYHSGRKEVFIARDDSASLFYHEERGVIQVATREAMLPKGAVKFPRNSAVTLDLSGKPLDSFTWSLKAASRSSYWQMDRARGESRGAHYDLWFGGSKAEAKREKAKERAKAKARLKLEAKALTGKAAPKLLASEHDRAVADEVARKFRDAQAAMFDRQAEAAGEKGGES